jgi:hypothetical protein
MEFLSCSFYIMFLFFFEIFSKIFLHNKQIIYIIILKLEMGKSHISYNILFYVTYGRVYLLILEL